MTYKMPECRRSDLWQGRMLWVGDLYSIHQRFRIAFASMKTLPNAESKYHHLNLVQGLLTLEVCEHHPQILDT